MNDWQDAEQRVERAQEHLQRRQWEAALRELQAAVEINPHNAPWLFNLGMVLDELGRFDEAADAYRKAVAIEPRDTRALNHLGVALHRTGRLKEALDTFALIETIDPAFEPSYCNRIITYSQLGRHDLADEMFYLARLYKDECPQCYYNIGRSLAERREYRKAIACWERALDMDGAHPRLHVRIAEALHTLGDLEQARQHYLLAVRNDPGDVETLVAFGALLEAMGRAEDALEKYRRATELAPEHPAGHFHLGQWLGRRPGRDEEASAALTKALQLDPTWPGANMRLAEIHLRAGRADRARRHLRREVLLRPEQPLMMLELSNLLLDTSQPRAAVACLKRLVAQQPQSIRALQNLAIAQFQTGRFDDAVHTSVMALRLAPGHRAVMYNLAVGCEREGEYEQGLEWVQRALAIYGRDERLRRVEFRLKVLALKARLGRAVRGAWRRVR